ncbi:MAG: sulfate adenylyltransferase [Acidobacteriota bacterium]
MAPPLGIEGTRRPGLPLVRSFVERHELEPIASGKNRCPRIVLTPREHTDLRRIAEGAYTPIAGFASREELESVVQSMRLPAGTPWPLPILLSASGTEVRALRQGSRALLVAPGGDPAGIMEVEEISAWDPASVVGGLYGTVDAAHPGVEEFLKSKEYLVAGPVRAFPWRQERLAGVRALSPRETRREFARRKWGTIAAFQTRNAIHRGHEHIHRVVMEIWDGLLIHPLVGPTRKEDLPADLRVRSCKTQIDSYYPHERTLLSLFPAPMWFAGPREALFHALVRRNYGCTHLILGRDHAGVGKYYGPLDAQKIFSRFPVEEIGIQPIFFSTAFYCRKCASTATRRSCPHDPKNHLSPSGTRVRESLHRGNRAPEELIRSEVWEVLASGETRS